MYTLHSMSVWQFYIDFLNVGSTRISGYHSKYCISQCFPQQIFSEMMGMQTFLPVVVWQATYSSDLHCQLIFHIANLKQVAKFVKHNSCKGACTVLDAVRKIHRTSEPIIAWKFQKCSGKFKQNSNKKKIKKTLNITVRNITERQHHILKELLRTEK